MGIVIKATKREPGSRSKLTKIRKSGQLAGVIYGYKAESTPILLDYTETEKTVRRNGYSAVFEIELDGKKINAVLSEIQRDALKGHVKHVDFLAINMTQLLEIEVPFTVVGNSVGVSKGGILTQPNQTLKLKVKPSDIPETIEVDISKLGIGDTLALGEVRDKFNFEVLNEDEYTLATVTPPSQSEEDSESGVTAGNDERTE